MKKRSIVSQDTEAADDQINPPISQKNIRGWLIVILLCLPLAYCGQKEIRLALERSEAKEICGAGGGGKLQSAGLFLYSSAMTHFFTC